MTTTANNIPVHAPLFPPDLANGSDDAEAVSVLVAAGEAACVVRDGPAGNELAWLAGSRAVHGSYARGAFRGAFGRVLATLEVGRELRAELRSGAAD
ncbi:MAG: hypothetical protein ACREER_10270 [Alphaproteobacteria bacterium]